MRERDRRTVGESCASTAGVMIAPGVFTVPGNLGLIADSRAASPKILQTTPAVGARPRSSESIPSLYENAAKFTVMARFALVVAR